MVGAKQFRFKVIGYTIITIEQLASFITLPVNRFMAIGDIALMKLDFVVKIDHKFMLRRVLQYCSEYWQLVSSILQMLLIELIE